MCQNLRSRAFTFLLLLLLVAAPVAAQTATDPETPSPTDGDWLVHHLSAEPATLNPIVATDAYASGINEYIYESLLKRDERTMELVPQLADSWEISDDHLTYTFHLKKHVKWQDGHPFTGRDVVFSYQRIMDPKVDAPHLRNYYQDIDSVELLDDYTVRYRYRIPYYRALDFCGGINIVPAHLFKESDDFNKHPIGRQPVGTGPYKLVKWDTGKEIVLVRDENYWGKKPHLLRHVYKIITEPTAAFQVLKQGGLDMMSLRPIQWARQTQSKRFNDEFRKLKYYLPSYSYIGWNSRQPFFSDKRVRKAMTMLMDRESFLQKVLLGLGTVVSGPFYINSPDYDKSIPLYPFDPKAALVLLKEAGWEDHDRDGILDKDGRAFDFEFLVSAGSKTGEQIATILQENLKAVGVRMSIRRLEWAVFIQRIDDRDFDACTLGWSMGWESDPFQIWHSSQADKGSNFVGFKNQEADLIIETARQEFDAEKRRALYHRFHAIVHEEEPYTFLFTLEALMAVSRRFEDVNVYAMGLAPLEWWVPEMRVKYR
ncbi:MAG: peptide-binding protein [Syntrophobacteraceae bacterium]